jgi:hypothetical protein
MRTKITLKSAAALLAAASLVSPAFANNGAEHQGIPHLDHVFLIMMENHGYYQVLNNPNEPYLNYLISSGKVNLATNYFAVGHPSLTNYLEVVGGSNFGVRSDNSPNWGSASCTPNIASGIVNADNAGGNAPVQVDTGSVCPISGTGNDAETPAVDNWNEVGTDSKGNIVVPYLADLDGVKSIPAAPATGITIADQLVNAGKTWKSYQETLPLGSVFGVNYSNGTVTNLDFDSTGHSTLLAPLTSKSVVQAYAVKHNPFAYFKSVQEGTPRGNGLENVVGFDGPDGLYADLARGDVPSFAFIAPNQCDDQHGRGNADAFCAFDFGDVNGFTNGTTANLNPGLIQQGDVSIQRLVEAIHASPAWHEGHSAIVIVWDENDYSGITSTPNGLFPPVNQNKVVLTVETNRGNHGVQSSNYYNSFSLLKSIEQALGLPCLNHACDPDVAAMSDLFGGGDHDNR